MINWGPIQDSPRLPLRGVEGAGPGGVNSPGPAPLPAGGAALRASSTTAPLGGPGQRHLQAAGPGASPITGGGSTPDPALAEASSLGGKHVGDQAPITGRIFPTRPGSLVAGMPLRGHRRWRRFPRNLTPEGALLAAFLVGVMGMCVIVVATQVAIALGWFTWIQ